MNSYFHNFSNLTAGFKFALIDKNLKVNVSVTNIFAQHSKADIYFTDNTQHFNNYWDGRSFRLTFNYNFGNSKIQNLTKEVNFEEKSRAK